MDNIIKEISYYKQALDASSIVAVTDQKGLIKSANDNFCRISQYTRDELVGQDHRIINSGYHPKEFFKTLWATISSGQVWKGEIKNRAKDGSFYWVDTTIVPFLNQDGKPYQYVAIRSDITQRKVAEEQLKKTNEELALHSRILETNNSQLVDFCNIVSHNLRGPLVNMSMLIDIIENSRDEAERRDMFGKIKKVIGNLNEVFGELVESIQVKYDVDVQLDQINLRQCLDTILQRFETQIQEYGAQVEVEVDAIAAIRFPEKYLDSIFTNLISNALKYRSPDRKPIIRVRTERVDERLLLSVADNGLGIDLQRHQHNLFKIRKVFHKHPDAKGFGLFMTKTQVEAMGGKIWAESAVDIGSTFFVEFGQQSM